MKRKTLYEVPKTVAKHTHINTNDYHRLYQHSIDDPADFWGVQGERFVSWFKPWKRVFSGGFEKLDMRWFVGGKLNACYNCLDRHLPKRADQTAIIWEGNELDESLKLTYAELFDQVCRFANVLKGLGVKKGDRVCIYLPMIPAMAVAMLACARIGAIHSVVFAGFSPEALKTRILDADCSILITADGGLYGPKKIPLKENADVACAGCPNVRNVVVVQRRGHDIPWDKVRDIWFHEAMEHASNECPPEVMDAMDPLFILYTSGSTGKPKGVLHSTGGYLVYAAMSHKYVFDYREGEVFWCTADAGWITGHTYIIYGPLTNGAITVMFSSVPTYPTASRFWQVIDKHKVNIFYTAPTAIRAIRREGDDLVNITSRKSLRLLGTVGEPISPRTWRWYYEVVGEKRCQIVDTWWQTETGGIMITPLPGATPLKPGSASWPFFGVVPDVVDDEGKPIKGGKSGHLVIKQPWPGMMQTIYGDPERFVHAYFETFPGCYETGDGARRDKDGYFWITGRIDDVINVSGHRLGTAEIEGILVSHPKISEVAVVGFPHEIKGQGIYAFVTPMARVTPDDQLRDELCELVRERIGPIAKPDTIRWAPGLPKTRSGKIMRRILRKIAVGETDDLGDISTLADPSVIDALIESKCDA